MNLIQLPLGVSLNGYATFDNLISGPNKQIHISVKQALLSEQFSCFYIWGQKGTGKTHLLQAACHDAAANSKSASYIPLQHYSDLGENFLKGQDLLDLVCIDDIANIAGKNSWEKALFFLFNEIKERNGVLIITSGCNVKELGITLPDLQTRLEWGLKYKLAELSDLDKIDALVLRCESRGIELSAETAKFVLNRSHRAIETLCVTIDQLAEAAISDHRKITIPFVKTILKL